MSKPLALLSVALLLTLFLSPVLALQVTDIQQSVQDNSTQLTQMRAEMNAKLSQINMDLNRYASKEDMSRMLQAHLELSNQLLNSYRQQLVITWTLTTLCALGAFFGVMMYFKSKRRL